MRLVLKFTQQESSTTRCTTALVAGVRLVAAALLDDVEGNHGAGAANGGDRQARVCLTDHLQARFDAGSDHVGARRAPLPQTVKRGRADPRRP